MNVAGDWNDSVRCYSEDEDINNESFGCSQGFGDFEDDSDDDQDMLGNMIRQQHSRGGDNDNAAAADAATVCGSVTSASTTSSADSVNLYKKNQSSRSTLLRGGKRPNGASSSSLDFFMLEDEEDSSLADSVNMKKQQQQNNNSRSSLLRGGRRPSKEDKDLLAPFDHGDVTPAAAAEDNTVAPSIANETVDSVQVYKQNKSSSSKSRGGRRPSKSGHSTHGDDEKRRSQRRSSHDRRSSPDGDEEHRSSSRRSSSSSDMECTRSQSKLLVKHGQDVTVLKTTSANPSDFPPPPARPCVRRTKSNDGMLSPRRSTRSSRRIRTNNADGGEAGSVETSSTIANSSLGEESEEEPSLMEHLRKSSTSKSSSSSWANESYHESSSTMEDFSKFLLGGEEPVQQQGPRVGLSKHLEGRGHRSRGSGCNASVGSMGSSSRGSHRQRQPSSFQLDNIVGSESFSSIPNCQPELFVDNPTTPMKTRTPSLQMVLSTPTNSGGGARRGSRSSPSKASLKMASPTGVMDYPGGSGDDVRPPTPPKPHCTLPLSVSPYKKKTNMIDDNATTMAAVTVWPSSSDEFGEEDFDKSAQDLNAFDDSFSKLGLVASAASFD